VVLTIIIKSLVTLVGSVANLIVAERSKAYYDFSFFRHIKFGVPVTLAQLVVGVPAISLMCALFS